MSWSAIMFGFTVNTINVNIKAGDWYEVSGENPQWSSTTFTTMLMLNFYHSPKQARTNSSTQTLKYYMFRASTLIVHALRAQVRASLSLYVPARVTHANGSPLSINQNLSAKLARLLQTTIKTINK